MTRATESSSVPPVSYVAVHQGPLVAGLLLLLVGIPAIYIEPNGLFYFIVPLPVFVWTSIGPLTVGSVLVLRSLFLIERVTIELDGNAIHMTAKRLVTRRESIPLGDIRYIDIRHLESKVMRWFAVFGLFLLSYEIHFKNGLDLLGHARVAPFLLLCFVAVCIALVIFVATPRQALEVGTDRTSCFVPLPGAALHRDAMTRITSIAGFHGETVAPMRPGDAARAIISREPFGLATGIAFFAMGASLAANSAWFFGDITAPALVVLGAKWIHDVLLGNKRLLKVGDAGEFRGYTGTLVARRILGGKTTREAVAGAEAIHPIEMAVYFYLIAQAMKHGFRAAFWPYLGFDAGYFVFGVLLIAVLFFRWFGTSEQLKVDFGAFSIRFPVLPGPGGSAGATSNRTAQTTIYVRNWLRWVGRSLVVPWSRKKLLWIAIVFIAFVLVPALYYGLSYPPYIF